MYDPTEYDLILQSYAYNFQASIIFVISATSSTEILKCTPPSLVLSELIFYRKLYPWPQFIFIKVEGLHLANLHEMKIFTGIFQLFLQNMQKS